MSPPSLAWCDGEVVPAERAVVSAFDRTLLYGLGAFETVRLHGGRPFQFERHLRRLRGSLAALSLPAPAALDRLTDGLSELSVASRRPAAICRVTVTAGPDPADGLPGAPRVLALLREVPPPPAPGSVRIGIAPVAHDPRSPLAGLKSTSYLTHYLLREAAERDGRLDDLMVDPQGRITEGTVSSVFVVRDGRLLTPPLGAGILAGVTRGVVLELAARQGLACEEAELPREALRAVDECFLTGAGKILVSVDELDGRRLPARRPVTAAVRAALVAAIAAACDVEPGSIRF